MNNKDINVWSYLEQYSDDEEVIIEIVRKVFKSGKLVLGENVSQFENEFSLWINSKYGTGVGNGTDAIKIALMAGGVKKGDEVITVSNTAVPTVSAIVETGAKPVFVDIDLDTYNMSVSELKKAISKKTKAVVAVHLYGHPCEIREIKKICKEKNVFLVEDCAQSHGSRLNNKKCGSFGDISAFSFYPTKILGAFGDGGMCVTSKKIYDEKLKMTRFYGMKENYYSLANGVNSRLDEVQAAILRYKLSSLDSEILRRREIAELYNDGLKNTSLILPKEKTGAYHSYYLYVVRHPQREKILKELKKLGINLNISYPWPIHTMPPFSKYKKGSLKNTEFVAKEIFSLPMYPGLTNEKIQTVIKSLKKIC